MCACVRVRARAYRRCVRAGGGVGVVWRCWVVGAGLCVAWCVVGGGVVCAYLFCSRSLFSRCSLAVLSLALSLSLSLSLCLGGGVWRVAWYLFSFCVCVRAYLFFAVGWVHPSFRSLIVYLIVMCTCIYRYLYRYLYLLVCL